MRDLVSYSEHNTKTTLKSRNEIAKDSPDMHHCPNIASIK